ncbi:MAG TPA: prolyl oligopeptidase family serine peptidase [Gemmatimonadaceae bacterium]|nr:prolyl oligopeptidase family serine peptidase [Gemmatimonadaceae bacterium]
MRTRLFAVGTAIASFLWASVPLLQARAQNKPTIAQFMSPASPLEIVAARKADRIAWIAYERGMRNVYSAVAPSFRPVRLTRFLEDDGIDLTSLRISDDGSVVVFVRGSAPNRLGWVANPTHNPDGARREIWAVRTAGGPAWRVAEGGAPELSPDGRYVLYVKDGQIYRAPVRASTTTTAADRGEKPFITAWGTNGSPRWSPDGRYIAFVSNRVNHSFIGVYDSRTHSVKYIAPSVDFDAAPAWSPDSRRIAFTRRPGLPFGQQAQQGSGSIGNPAGPAAAGSTGICAGSGGRGGFGRGGATPDSTSAVDRLFPGLCRATFRGGHTLAIMIGDVESGTAEELWHNQPNDPVFTNITRLLWAGDNIVFPLSPPNDEWDRYWSLNVSRPEERPRLLTTTDGLIEDATSVALSPDGSTLYYCTNAGDIERRHIWAVPTSGGAPRQLSSGDGVETYPQPLASGRELAVLYFGAKQPASVALLSTGGGPARIVFPTLPRDFPTEAHVVPEIVIFKAPDGLEIHNQLFLPRDIAPGERRPAMVFVHGGPQRQMLPAYHYMQFYHWAYAFNQWLASQGYVVLSVNFRSGIGYGRSFRQAPNTGGRGNAEYQDILAAGKYLQSRPDVDPARIGIWGLSYGGVLTAQALARNSDIFVAGADLAGVHLWGSSLDTAAVSYRSSAIAAMDTWKSPVFLVHGDDDRNVDFAQTVGLVQLLRARNVYYELMVIPDDLHESMLHSRWLDTWERIGNFLHRFVWNKERPPVTR